MQTVQSRTERGVSANSTDEQLVQAMRAGSERAWRLVLVRYSPLIQSAARTYAKTCRSPEAHETQDDTASGLYLCMVERVRESILHYFRGECRLKTWIYRLVGDRRQIVKAFLVQTDSGRHRADTRLPRSIQRRPALDQEVYRRLVWGKDPAWIAWDLGLREAEAHTMCDEIIELLRSQSPRVYRRIMANRQALLPVLSLDRPIVTADGGSVMLETPDQSPLPDSVAEQRCLLDNQPAVHTTIRQALAGIPEGDVRLLLLVYDRGWSLSEVVDRAEMMGVEGIAARHQVDYRITRALRAIAARLCEHFTPDDDAGADCRDNVVSSLKDLFRERGVSSHLSPRCGAASPAETSVPGPQAG